MSPRLLVLTAGFGEGHNAAAHAVANAWDGQHGARSARVADVLALAAPRLNRHLRPSYLHLINRHPGLWRAAYRWIDRSTVLPWMLHQFRAERRTLARLVTEHRPAVICSTYPVYGLWLRQLAQQRPGLPPYFSVVTDSISINSLWWRGGGAGWFAPNAESCDVMTAAGVPAERIFCTGFPVAPIFAQLSTQLSPPDLRAAGARPAVLHLVHSGTRGAAETARRLLAQPDWAVTCAVGRDDALRAALSGLAQTRRAPTRILGWTQEIPQLLHTHHVVISKAGGATTQEALAARCPLIVTQVVPGQEEGNAELLRRHGIGALALTPEAVLQALTSAFAGQGAGWRAWREAATPLSRPAAAQAIVDILTEQARAYSETHHALLPRT